MNKIAKAMGWAVLAVMVTLSTNLMAAEKSAEAVKMDPAMEAAMKASMPGENHKVLEPFIGSWTHTAQWWMKPGDNPQASAGTDVNKWIMGGRFVQLESKGNMNGQPFEGMGFTGYDNVKGEYTSIWIDNMTTGMMMASGQYDPASKTVKQQGTFSCPMTNEKNMWLRSEWKVLSNDKHSYTMYMKGPDGKEFKSLELIYKRVK